jgi:hypothetical protein
MYEYTAPVSPAIANVGVPVAGVVTASTCTWTEVAAFSTVIAICETARPVTEIGDVIVDPAATLENVWVACGVGADGAPSPVD